MCNLNELKREDIIKAIEEYKNMKKKDIANPKRESTKYNLIINNEKFPPKYIVAIACGLKNNTEISPIEEFNAQTAVRILKKMKFEITDKVEISNEKDFRRFLDDIEQSQGKNKGKFYDKKTKDNFINRLKNLRKDIFFISDKSDIDEIITSIQKGEINYDNRYSTTTALNYYSEFLDKLKNRIQKNINMKIKNIILYGVAGVGKTHNTNQLIKLIDDRNSEQEIFSTIQNNKYSENMDISDIKKRVKFITFHQNFGYEDFIEGFRPNKEGKIILVDGIFKEICKEAIENREKNYYLVIDEINRGNISKIFGELITLIEEDKRNRLEVTLPYSKKAFKIPSNLYIIGTMNSSDKSIALIDIALRRRFTFLKMKPNSNLIEYSKAKEIFKKLNEYISTNLSEDYQIGHSYFINIKNDDDLKFVLKYKIEPLLEEYFYGDDRLTEAKKIYGENL